MEVARTLWRRVRDRDEPDHGLGVYIWGFLRQEHEVEAALSLRLAGDLNHKDAIELTARAVEHVRGGRYREAIEAVDRALDRDENIGIVAVQSKLEALMALGRFDQAESVATRNVERITRLYGQNYALATKYQHALVLKRAGRLTESRDVLRALLLAQTRAFGRDHTDTRDTAATIAHVELLLSPHHGR